MRYRDRKGNESNGEEWTGQTACICLWTCCDQTVDPSATVTDSVT